MTSYYIQPGHRCWLVMRDGKPMAKVTRPHLALSLAEMLVASSVRHGEEAVLTGIATEPLAILPNAA